MNNILNTTADRWDWNKKDRCVELYVWCEGKCHIVMDAIIPNPTSPCRVWKEHCSANHSFSKSFSPFFFFDCSVSLPL